MPITFVNKTYVSIGKNSNINTEGHITAHPEGEIHIGDNVQIGPYIVMNTGDHIEKFEWYRNFDRLMRKYNLWG